MPRRQTQLRGPKDKDPSSKKPAPKKNTGKKALNALSIAESQVTDKLGVRRNRLGKIHDPSKRKRNPNRDMDDSDGPDNKRRRFGGDDESELSSNAGSDGEGHRWRLGQVDSDDDEELDSDEALGTSDEERFEGFTFRGSSTTNAGSKPKPKKSKRVREINLDEDVEESEEEDEDMDEDDDLGEDAIDLTTAWDLNTAEEEKEKAAASKKKQAEPDESEEYDSDSEENDDGSDEESGLSMSGDEAEVDEHGLSKLQSFVNALEPESTNKPSRRAGGAQEHAKPTEYGLTSSRKLTVADLLPSITDSRLKSSLKHVDATPSSHKQSSGIPGKLDAPLAKRQQDRLDRAAAYEKSKETLNRWLETVKANRRAEHLMFPLPDPDAQQIHRIGPTKPQTDLEATIHNILVESGLADPSGKSTEEQVQEFEELQARKLPIEEIRARRAELRKQRDLLFREEVRAKRIKKIKSKSYRRVHRKERERLQQQERQALLEAGVDLEEEDREMNERRRAEARMGAKLKDSKWAKSLKQTGRTAWDEDARRGAAEQALKEEELRRRIEGKSVSRADEDYLGSSSSESEDEDPWAEDAGSDAEKQKLRKKLEGLERDDVDASEITGPHAKLFSMKFMQNAEAARKAENDAEIRRLNRELRGEEESQSEAESEVGRRKFGQSQDDKSGKDMKQKSLPRTEFEEAPGSDDEADAAPDQEVGIVVNQFNKKKSSERSGKPQSARPSGGAPEQKATTIEEENPWLVTKRNNRRATADDSQQIIDATLGAETVEAPKKQKDKPIVSSTLGQAEDDNGSDDEESVPVLLKNHDLVKRAFAGDEVVQEFEQDKLETIEEEGDKVIDETLPGWGSKVEGVKPENRKDAKLSRVIINEKRIRKNTKYMATQLPHPFETKAQYERSLRLPIGPEWSTKETLQNATKPRVMIKQGIIKPMEKPMI